jgi:hypothetical protein
MNDEIDLNNLGIDDLPLDLVKDLAFAKREERRLKRDEDAYSEITIEENVLNNEKYILARN